MLIRAVLVLCLSFYSGCTSDALGSDAYPHCLIEAFAQALLHAEVVPLHLAERTDLGFAARFAIHRNNVRGARTEALRQGFPVLERLLGQEYFTALVGVFIQRHPPCSAALHEYGGEMAEFIEAFAPVAQLGYLADIARLEWARLCAFHATDAPVPDLSAEALPALARLLDAPLRWHPSVTLLQQGGRLASALARPDVELQAGFSRLASLLQWQVFRLLE